MAISSTVSGKRKRQEIQIRPDEPVKDAVHWHLSLLDEGITEDRVADSKLTVVVQSNTPFVL